VKTFNQQREAIIEDKQVGEVVALELKGKGLEDERGGVAGIKGDGAVHLDDVCAGTGQGLGACTRPRSCPSEIRASSSRPPLPAPTPEFKISRQYDNILCGGKASAFCVLLGFGLLAAAGLLQLSKKMIDLDELRILAD